MGIPSLSIYVNELITQYGVKNLIRVGTCGTMQPEIKLRDVILAMTSSTNSSINKQRFKGMDYAPAASFKLLKRAYDAATSRNMPVRVGGILSSDTFYDEDPEEWKLWAKYGVLAVEMETTGLYTLAAKYGVNALTILTVSDSLVTGQATTSEEREKTFKDMIEIALDVAE
jgi:purine-nucleoside phosphorylase